MDKRFQTFLQYGQFGNGYRLEQGLLWGQFWTRRSGCYLLFRGEGAAQSIDYDWIENSVSEKGSFTVPPFLSHEAGKTYYYAIRRVSESGKQERNTTAVVCLSLDEKKRRYLDRPNSICGFRAHQIGVQRVRLSWWYNPLGQEARCERFWIYRDEGDGFVHYNQAVAEVEYRGGGYYSCEVETGLAGRCRLGICAASQTVQAGDISEISIEMKGGCLSKLNGVGITPSV